MDHTLLSVPGLHGNAGLLWFSSILNLHRLTCQQSDSMSDVTSTGLKESREIRREKIKGT